MISDASAPIAPRGQTLTCLVVILNFVAATATATGSKRHSDVYRLSDWEGTKVSDKQFALHKLRPDKFHAHSSHKLPRNKIGS